MGDVSFSASEVAVIAGLLASLVTPLVALFWLLLAAKDASIKRLEATLERSENQAEQLLPALKEQVYTMNVTLVSALKEQERQGRVLDEIDRRVGPGRAR